MLALKLFATMLDSFACFLYWWSTIGIFSLMGNTKPVNLDSLNAPNSNEANKLVKLLTLISTDILHCRSGWCLDHWIWMSLHSSTSKPCQTGNATSKPSKHVEEMLRNCLSMSFWPINLLALVMQMPLNIYQCQKFRLLGEKPHSLLIAFSNVVMYSFVLSVCEQDCSKAVGVLWWNL